MVIQPRICKEILRELELVQSIWILHRLCLNNLNFNIKNLKLRKFKTDTVFFHNEKITVGYWAYKNNRFNLIFYIMSFQWKHRRNITNQINSENNFPFDWCIFGKRKKILFSSNKWILKYLLQKYWIDFIDFRTPPPSEKKQTKTCSTPSRVLRLLDIYIYRYKRSTYINDILTLHQQKVN